jgi:hypothetical protein
MNAVAIEGLHFPAARRQTRGTGSEIGSLSQSDISDCPRFLRYYYLVGRRRCNLPGQSEKAT